MNFDGNYVRDYRPVHESQSRGFVATEATAAELMRNVYLWMAGALAVSGLTAFYVASSPAFLELIFANSVAFWGLVIVELGLVFGLGLGIQKMSYPVAACMFALYSILNGATLATIFMLYTMESITATFFITAGTFGTMALIGTFVKRDMSKLGGLSLMVLIGVVVATVVNLFLKSTVLDLVISIVGVLVFVGLTAYDAQRIKLMMEEYAAAGDGDVVKKAAVMGALSLYLDFVNLFLYLLRFLGRRK